MIEYGAGRELEPSIAGPYSMYCWRDVSWKALLSIVGGMPCPT